MLLNRTNAPHGHVRSALDTIEPRADDLMTAVPNWRRVRAHAAAIRRAWGVYRPQAVHDRAPQAFLEAVGPVLAGLRAAIDARDADATREAANDLRAAAVDLANFYNPRIPADLKRLDVLQREFTLDVRAGDWTAATIGHAKAADAVWARLRPFVLLHSGGAGLAAELDAIFAEQADALEANNAPEAIEAAQDAMDVIDEIEDGY